MTPAEIVGAMTGAVLVLLALGGAVWRAAAAATSAAAAGKSAEAAAAAAAKALEAVQEVKLELVELRVELRSLLRSPPKWCGDLRRDCRDDCPAREPTGVRAQPGGA